MSDRYLIIHGHFYQPPRENPWILAIEPQDSASPFENWNQRINRECYAPNCQSRLLDQRGHIARLVNNYEYLSFNFGPTLLTWLSQADPATYRRILAADKKAAADRGGHGPALAQVYNHIIMPLASARDRLTQIRWGVEDFAGRFGRRPEGMWLAETAVDLETLRLLAQEGLQFTILSQTQGQAVRPLAARETPARPGSPDPDWLDVSDGRIDPREPYRVFWGSGPSDYLDVFFYDGPVSRAIAFERLLSDGRTFLNRVEEAFGRPEPVGKPRLVNLATDGESYGHHFQFGDMALAWLFNHLEERAGEPEAIRLTNYGQYLEMFPPTKEARIVDNTAWSCAHGVERWRSDCGCSAGGGGGTWNQKWRTPLRDGLDWLRDELAAIFETEGAALFKDPWAARDGYVRVLLSNYDSATRRAFLAAHQRRPLDPAENALAWALLESQLMSQYMFTSCAWFFDDISGLEPVQNLRYALRAIELVQGLGRTDLVRGLGRYLETIRPNNPDYATGLEVWQKLVAPDSLSGRLLTAHWAAATILKVPRVLDFFVVPRFTGETVTHLRGDGLEILAAQVELTDRRLDRVDHHLCLAIYSGGTHLAILAGEAGSPGTSAAQTPPEWLDEKKLRAALGESLKAPAALSIWELMIKLMPLTTRYVMEDLLPYCRGRLLSTLVEDIYDNLKSRAQDIFHLHQHLLMMNRAAGQPINWVERFLFRVLGEYELKRILGPADFDRPVNLPALTNLLHRRGLVGLARDDSLVAELGADYLKNAFRTLTRSETRPRHLREILGFVRLIRSENFSFDFWESQNQWSELAGNQAFLNLMTPEERALMDELGQALGFAVTEH